MLLDRKAALGDDVARVYTAVQQHHRVAGLGLAVDDRPVDRRPPSVPGQQRGVEADAAEPGDLEDLLAQ